MQKAAILSALLAASASAAESNQKLTLRKLSSENRWGRYKNTFAKIYDTAESELHAFENFMANDDIIESHNSKGLSYTLGHNKFSDLSWDEFQEIYVNGMSGNPHLRRHKNYEDLPAATADAVDWVSKGAVTPVKDQGQCGSCWAFSTTGSFEGAYQIATGDLVSLSEQNLVSCDTVDDGCSGGLMDNAFGWIKKNGGLCTEEDYPYTSGSGSSGSCKSSCSKAATLSGWSDVKQGDEDALKSAVAKGPVSVAIEADKSVFQLYKSGVFTSAEECGTQLDHGVLVVGYGTDGGNDYWKVKNSWGGSWGENGYIRMVRDKDCCGIASQPSYPTGVTKVGPGPSPGPSPSPPSPTPTPSGQSHYGAPPCRSDEQAVQVQGVSGDFCSPSCTNGACPTDVPSGVTAKPSCILQSPTGDKYCALECTPSTFTSNGSNGECGEGECQEVQAGIGICTYGSGPTPSPTPTPTPTPGPTPGPSPSSGDYGAPPCPEGEQNVQVQGVDGSFCSPACDSSGSCPTDVPEGVTGKPECLLQDQSGDKYCAVACVPLLSDIKNECGQGKCQSIESGILGICTYPDQAPATRKLSIA